MLGFLQKILLKKKDGGEVEGGETSVEEKQKVLA